MSDLGALAPTRKREAKRRKFPVVEIFGPTIQGEGYLAGVPSHFIRFGGCDYRCEWCDSLHAVIPEQVRKNSTKMTAPDIAERIYGLTMTPWVTFSGGNPALLELDDLAVLLRTGGYKISVETQGSMWKDWLAHIDHLTISPKPPSSRMVTAEQVRTEHAFCDKALFRLPFDLRSIKIVVFDQEDLDWAREFLSHRTGDWRVFLSVGTDPPKPGETVTQTRDLIGDRLCWLYEELNRKPLRGFQLSVLPQLHVIAWGHRLGV